MEGLEAALKTAVSEPELVADLLETCKLQNIGVAHLAQCTPADIATQLFLTPEEAERLVAACYAGGVAHHVSNAPDRGLQRAGPPTPHPPYDLNVVRPSMGPGIRKERTPGHIQGFPGFATLTPDPASV